MNKVPEPTFPTRFDPEKLNLWDRIFNRYRNEFHGKGVEGWHRSCFNGVKIPGSEYPRDWVEYKKIDRLTGGYTIFREYIS